MTPVKSSPQPVPELATLLQKPAHWNESIAEEWFSNIAGHLLNHSRLLAGGEMHRLVEVECYYHGPGHFDPFAHRDPIQLETGRWYFHRTGGTYRSGSFKGIDLSFGDGTAYNGFLIRGLEKPDGELVDGPSLVVDYLLGKTATKTVAELARRIDNQRAWEPENPVGLAPHTATETLPIYRSARVGLSLKRANRQPTMSEFLLRRYRFLTEPRRTAKGKVLLVLALHLEGKSADEIRTLTGCPKAAIERYIKELAAGSIDAEFDHYFGKELTSTGLCRLHGKR